MEQIINFLYSFTGDLGVTIIFLTISVKGLLLPISLKSRKATSKQLALNTKIEEIKSKYGKNKKKLEKELQKIQGDSIKSMGGCILQFVQLPVISLLYMSITKFPIESATYLVPWVESIKLTDPFYIIPILYAIVSIIPTIINHFRNDDNKVNPIMSVMLALFSLFITVKAPIAIGIYFITSSIFTLIESEGYRLYSHSNI